MRLIKGETRYCGYTSWESEEAFPVWVSNSMGAMAPECGRYPESHPSEESGGDAGGYPGVILVTAKLGSGGDRICVAEL